jgi:hypothetical protein
MSSLNVEQRKFVVKAGMTIDDAKMLIMLLRFNRSMQVNRSGFNPTKNKICVGLKPDLYTDLIYWKS